MNGQVPVVEDKEVGPGGSKVAGVSQGLHKEFGQVVEAECVVNLEIGFWFNVVVTVDVFRGE